MLIPIRMKFSQHHCAELQYISERKRLDGEIIPVSAQHSHAYKDNEAMYAAAHAIDLQLETRSGTTKGSDNRIWLQFKLDRLYCVEKVVEYDYDGTKQYTWTCTDKDCTKCVGSSCDKNVLTVISEKAAANILAPEAECKYGNFVKLALTAEAKGNLIVYEIVITGKGGENIFGQ